MTCEPSPSFTPRSTRACAASRRALGVERIQLYQLHARFSFGRTRRAQSAAPAVAGASGEVVLIMGLPGAGKSTLASRFVADGYVRLNRDETGGTLRALLPAFDRALAGGAVPRAARARAGMAPRRPSFRRRREAPRLDGSAVVQSWRSATTGSMRVARRAGMSAAAAQAETTQMNVAA